MSETPPPFGDDSSPTTTTEPNKEINLDQPTDIDLNDDSTSNDAGQHVTTNGNDLESSNNTKLTNSHAPAPSDDLFFSTISDPDVLNEKSKTEDMDELFRINKPATTTATSPTKEVQLNDDDEDDPFSPSNPKNNSGDVNGIETKPAPTIETKAAPVSSVTTPADVKVQTSLSSQKSIESKDISDVSASFQKQTLAASNSIYSMKPEEDEEDRDKFLEIVLSDPHKMGDGMGSYMVYKITTKTNYPMFKSKEFTTNRRFSDFLNLFEKLKEKHLPAGRILPPAPEKDMIGMAKVKMSKEDSSPTEFIGKRRAALERFLNRLAKHKSFRYDPDFRDFIEISDDLPRASNTSALSGANVLKLFKNVTDSVSKIAFKMDETDQWFEEKSRQIENLYVQYKKMYSMVELLYGWRKDLAISVKDFSKNISILANSEEQLSLSRALSQLGEVYEKIDQIYVDQSNSDYFTFGELVKDYVSLFDNVKEVFYQRIKIFGVWQKAEETLKSKKDAKAKLEASNKLDKVPAVAAEIKDWESKVEKCKEDFEQISKTIKEEVRRFDLERAHEFATELTKYIEKMVKNQENIVKIWEQYLPEIKAI